MVLWLVVLATENTAGDPLVWLFNLGTAGVWLICYMTGLIHGKPEVDYLKKQLEERDKIIETMRVQLTDRTLPALARVGQVMADYPQAAQNEVALAHTLESLVGRVERVLRDERN